MNILHEIGRVRDRLTWLSRIKSKKILENDGHIIRSADLRNAASFVSEIRTGNPPILKNINAILIDDDDYVADIFNSVGSLIGSSVQHFRSIGSFLEVESKLDRKTYLFIDWYLNRSIDSSEIIRDLFEELKFSNIFLVSSLDFVDEMTSIRPFIKGFISKSEPWKILDSIK